MRALDDDHQFQFHGADCARSLSSTINDSDDVILVLKPKLKQFAPDEGPQYSQLEANVNSVFE
jgi:hypothetical protein